MKLSHSMALALAMSLGPMSLAQDLATDVGKGVKDTEKATKTVAKVRPATPEKQLKNGSSHRQGSERYGLGHDEGCQENRECQ